MILAEQTGLSLTWLETLKIGFLVTRLNLSEVFSVVSASTVQELIAYTS